jgi:hypothetical protein
MPAYLLLLAALLSRVVPHSGWFGFTAVGASLLYFGARRNWREMLLPVAAFAALDYYLTTHVYSYPFAVQDYLITWAWYAAALALGHILLSTKVSTIRVASATLLGPTSFFLVSNYAAWIALSHAGGRYASTFSGLIACYVEGIPYYGRDLASTALILAIAFGAPAVIRNYQHDSTTALRS